MDDTAVNAAIAKFLRSISASAQREIEKAVRQAAAAGKVAEGETLTIGATLTNETLALDITIFNKIEL
ncbi:MAG TPA: DUF6494 family protein [Pseudolabrys sp.]|nr:DUF6494 family protein [Pseudolabrys sp.]